MSQVSQVESFLALADAYRVAVRQQQLIDENLRWTPLYDVFYATTPVSASQITISDTLGLIAGTPIKFVQDGTDYYAIISAVATGLITISGAPLDTAKPIQMLYLGKPELVQQMKMELPGEYGGVAGDASLAAGKMNAWLGGPAYLVNALIWHTTDKTGGTKNPTTGLYVGLAGAGAAVFTSNVVVSQTSQYQTAADTARYRMTRGSYLSLRNSDLDDGSPHASNLNATLTFVLE